MSNKHADEVGGMKVGHGDIPKWLYPVYIGLLLWAAYYFILDNNYNGYTRPKVDPNSFAGLKVKYGCDSCHNLSTYPSLTDAKKYFASTDELIKYLDDPVAAPVKDATFAPLMQGIAKQLSADEKKIIADELMK